MNEIKMIYQNNSKTLYANTYEFDYNNMALIVDNKKRYSLKRMTALFIDGQRYL